MRFLSFSHHGRSSFGFVVNDEIADVGAMYPQYPTLADFIASDIFADRDGQLAGRCEPGIKLSEVEFEPVIPRAEKVICLSRNYMDHQKEAVAGGLDRKITDYPPIFLRVWRSLTGHRRPMVLPRVSQQLDWEGELAVVIGKGGRHIPASEAMKHVAGYSCFNDGSIRDYQHHAYQITPGKNFAETGPLGPFLVTPDEIADPENLTLETRVNGEVVQSTSTSLMIFGIARIIEYCSDIFPLAPGDVIATGTPSGVGWGRRPQVWLRAGDTVEVVISGVGVLSNTVVAEG